jgi:hypothetical protein
VTGAEVQRLRAEVKSDLEAFAARVDELALVDPSSGEPPVVAQVAVALHHAYGAVEAALARVARLVEGSLPQGADWHQQLLQTMGLDIPSVRPAVLSAPTSAGLRKLLAFRHFFRHAYSVAWDTQQLASLREVALALRGPLERDFAALDSFLARTATALGG